MTSDTKRNREFVAAILEVVKGLYRAHADKDDGFAIHYADIADAHLPEAALPEEMYQAYKARLSVLKRRLEEEGITSILVNHHYFVSAPPTPEEIRSGTLAQYLSVGRGKDAHGLYFPGLDDPLEINQLKLGVTQTYGKAESERHRMKLALESSRLTEERVREIDGDGRRVIEDKTRRPSGARLLEDKENG